MAFPPVSDQAGLGILPNVDMDDNSSGRRRSSTAHAEPPAKEACGSPSLSSAKRSSAGTAAGLCEKQEDSRSCVSARTLLMSGLVSMGGLIFGYGGVGQIGGFLAMRDYRARFGDAFDVDTLEFRFSNARAGTIVGLLMIGGMMGSLAAAPITERFGRKKSISLWCFVYLVGQAVEVSTMTAWYQIVLGRLVEGFGIGGLSVLTPMYQSETAPKQIRGALISTYQLFITFGILLACLVNLGTFSYESSWSWRTTMSIAMIWPTIMGVGMTLMPESPRWDYRHGNTDRAARTMAQIYQVSTDHPQVLQELRKIQEAEDAEKTAGNARWYEVFTAPTMLKRVTVGMALQMGQQCTGANYFFYFGTTLFASAGVGNSYVTAVILGAVNFLATFAGLWICERFGRRKALMAGAAEIGVSLLIFASLGYTSLNHSSSVEVPTAGAIMVAFACLAIIGFATTWGPLPWVVCAEIYPLKYKASAMALATGTNWGFNFLIAFLTPFITNAIGYSLGYVFGIITLSMVAFVYFFVHETAGKSLEEIDTMILEGVRPRQSARWASGSTGE